MEPPVPVYGEPSQYMESSLTLPAGPAMGCPWRAHELNMSTAIGSTLIVIGKSTGTTPPPDGSQGTGCGGVGLRGGGGTGLLPLNTLLINGPLTSSINGEINWQLV